MQMSRSILIKIMNPLKNVYYASFRSFYPGYQSKIILVMRYETRYPVIFAELSSKFYLLLGAASTANLEKRNEFPKF